MCWGADMPNLVEWMPLGGEPGCREAAMDAQNIKLFGQTISVGSHHTSGAGTDAEVLKPMSASPSWDTAPPSRQDGIENKGVVENLTSARSSSGDGFLQPLKFCKVVTEYGTPTVGSRLSEDSSEGGHSDELKDQSEGDHSHSVGNDKHLPKPDKVVPCPRCDSMDTKFCYYNNYNVNQPRHFCKNCQRYWTAGGTLRNVPVGAGRRKNKHGGGALLQRDSCSEASASPLFPGALGSPTSHKGASYKQSQAKRTAGQNSPMRSHGSASSFGQDSGITILSPQYSLHQNGRLPFQAYATSQGFMTSGTETSAVASPDSASTPHQKAFPSGNGFDKNCSRSSLSVLMQDPATFGTLQSAFTAPISQQLESSATYRSGASSDMSSGWAGNDGPPDRHFNGDYPNGYHLEWDGKKQHSLSSSQGGGPSFSTPAQRIYNSVPPLLSTSSWTPDPASSPWPSNVGYASHMQMAAPSWPGAQPTGRCISEQHLNQHQPQPVATTLGKRGASDAGRLGISFRSPSKSLRTDERRSMWPMLGRSQSDVNSSLKLFQPKLELPGACDQNRLFINSAAARPVPFPVIT